MVARPSTQPLSLSPSTTLDFEKTLRVQSHRDLRESIKFKMENQPPRPPSPTQSTATTSNNPSESSPCNSYTKFYGCYLLVSRSSELYSAGRTYVGFTVNPPRRLKQHNGELKYGGAKRTSKHRPWQMVAVIHGFSSKTQGLQFEWAWQNPVKSVALKLHADRPNAITLPSTRKNTVKARLQTLAAMASIPPWCLCPLTLTICAPREDWETLKINELVFPKHLRVQFDTLSSLAASVRNYDYRHRCDSIVPRPLTPNRNKCPACNDDISFVTIPGLSGNQRRLTHCSACGVIVHIACLASCRVQDGYPAEALLPNIVKCPACQAQMHWSLVVRLARALYSED